MWRLTVALVAFVTATSAIAAAATFIGLRKLAERPADYVGQTVRTCGWARNGFEEQWISVARYPYAPDGTIAPGFEVDWHKRAERTAQGESEWRCISGHVEPTCGPLPETDTAVCVSTGSPYGWKIVQEF